MTTSPALPLAGMTVLDLTRNVAGPFCTMILAELGCDVIKVESRHGDDTRAWGPPLWDGISPTFLALNRNKRSIALDLSDAEDLVTLTAIAERADIVVDSFKPGSLEELGLGYEWAKALNARVVYCRISAFGARGPRSGDPGYDPIIQAVSGLMSVTGLEGSPPVRVGTSIMDMGTGLWGAIGILAALQNCGDEGRLVETSLYETAITWMCYHLGTYWGSGVVPRRNGTALGFISPYESFPVNDGHIIIGAPNDGIFLRVCGVLEMPELASDPRFVDNPSRVQNRTALHDKIAAATDQRAGAELEKALLSAGVPAGVVRNTADLAADEQANALGIFQELAHPLIENFRSVGLPISLDGERPPLRLAPPLLNEHAAQLGEALRSRESHPL